MVNWITQCTEWLSSALPAWNNVLNYLMDYTWLELVDQVIITPLRLQLGLVFPDFFRVWDLLAEFLASTPYGQATVVSWLLMNSAAIMLVYLAVYFVKWLVGVFT